MSSAYICNTCRRELRQRLSRRHNFQWLSKATFISFNEIVPPQKDQHQVENEGKLPHPRARRQGKVDATDETASRPAEEVKTEHKTSGADTAPQGFAGGRYSRFGSGRQDSDFQANNDNLRSLFATLSRGLDSLSPMEAARLNPTPSVEEQEINYPPEPAILEVSTKADTPAVKIWALLSTKDHDAKKAWDMFQEYYIKPGKECDALKAPSPQDRAIIRQKKLFRELLRSVAAQWEPGNDRLPAPGEVVRTLYENKIMGQGWYLLEILELLYRTTRLSAESKAEEDIAETRIILEEQILSLWSQFLRNSSARWTRTNQLQSKPAKKGLVSWNKTVNPENLGFSKSLGSDAYKLAFRLHRLFENVPSASAQHLAAAAIFTLDYFAHQYCRPYAVCDDRVPYEPFLRLMIRVLHGAQETDIAVALGISLLEDNNIPADEIARITGRLKHLQQRAALAVAIDDLQALGSQNVNLTEEQDNKLIAYFNTRIKRQIERQNRGIIDQLWEQAQLAYASADTSDDGPSNLIPPKIYSAFLFGYRDLQEPERQAIVWNHMLASGISANHQQWGLMMSARMKHLNSMEHIWKRMLASGMHPDHQTWCTRLSGHIYYGNPEEGMQLLYEWGNAWYNEVKQIFYEHNVPVPELSRLNRSGPTMPRPNTDTLTTVITALVQRKGGRGRRLDLVPDAFAWAHTFGVKPNLWTYNILFRTCLKDGNLKEAMQILTKMEEDNIKPDSFTFYGFADFVFKQANKSAMSEDQQYQLMFSILDMLEQRGLDPNAVFFGSMIDGLLKRGQDNPPNINAAMMLLRIMLDKGVVIPSQIWTSLMTHYFQDARRLDGPGILDLAAVEALWRRMNQVPSLVLDAVFYDRMIENCSSFGEISRAIVFLDRMTKEGKRPGWPALTALLSAYIDQNLVDQAQGLVGDVVRGTGLLRDGVRSARDTSRNPARENFFAVAADAGLLSGEEDLSAVKEYGVSDAAGMQLPDGDGYSTRVSSASAEMPSLEQIEEVFNKEMDLMPGWDEVVEQNASTSGR